MRVSKLLALIVVIALVFTGVHCKKSADPTEEEFSFIGTWIASPDVEGTAMILDARDVNPIFFVDAVSILGAVVTVVITEEDSYTMTVVMGGDSLLEEVGTILFEGNEVTLTPDDVPEEALTYTYSRDGNLVSLVGEDIPWEFWGTGTEIPTTITLIIKKVQ